jgi:hypothetical protein
VLAFQLSATVCGEIETPVPDTDTLVGEPVALLAIATFPFTAPAVVGANVTVRTAVWFGVSIKPAVTPLDVNPAPVVVTLEMVMFEFPLFFRVVVSALLLPVFTLPNGKLAGVAPSSVVEAAPVPLSAMASGEFGALLTNETDPLAAPAVAGANTTLNVVFPPAAIVLGKERPLVLKPEPVTLAAVIVTLAFPPFDNVIVCELLFPVITLPKLTLAGFAVSCA